MLRCLYRPGWDPLPDGHALPTDNSAASQADRERICDGIIAETPRPLWGGPGDFQDLVAERLRALTLTERIDREIQWTERVRDMHEYDYDPLKY